MTAFVDVMVELGTTGGLGRLRCGAPLAEIVAALGPPVDLGRIRKRFRWPHRFCYGDVELTACRCRLVTSVHMSSLENPGPDIPGCDVEFVGRLTYPQLTAALDTAGCSWQLSPHQTSDEVALYTAPSVDIRAGFAFATTDGQATHEHFLAKASAWTMAAHDCPPVSADTVDDGLGGR